MKKGDEEVGLGFFEVCFEPLGHFSAGASVEVVGVEADEVDAAEVKRVVGFFSRGESACFCIGGADVGVVVGADTGCAFGGPPFVVPHGGPANRIAQGGLVHGKKAAVEFLVGAGSVGHVPDVNVEVEWFVERGVVVDHGCVDIGLSFSAGSGIANDPEVNGGVGSRSGVGFEMVGRVSGCESGLAIVNGVVVGGGGFESANRGFKLVSADRCVFEDRSYRVQGRVTPGEDAVGGDFGIERVMAEAVAHAWGGIARGSPDDANGLVSGQLQVRCTDKGGVVGRCDKAGEEEGNERTNNHGRRSFNVF